MKTIKILLVSAAIFFSGVCCCDDGTDAREIRTARGVVTSRDWVKSIIVVNYIRFFVPPDTKIYKGNSTIGFTGVNLSDSVIVKYYQDSSGAYNAVEITVEYYGDFPV